MASNIAEGEDIGLQIYDCPPSQDTKLMSHWHYPPKFIPDGCVEYDDYSEGGIWMLFYPVSEIDEKWEMAKNLFDTGELRGVRGMKVSTAKYNPRTSDNTKRVLKMCCGPWTDERLMRKIGANVAQKTKYEDKYGYMRYKTNEQTRGGTIATGQAVNHVYQIQVPRPIEGTTSSAMAECMPSKDRRGYGQWHPKTIDGINYDLSTSGKWMLFYPTSEIDDRWHLVKSLFDAGKLQGVAELQVSTSKGNDGHPDSGVINVYCGPYEDGELMMRIGDNIAKKMKYKNRNGFMFYQTEGKHIGGAIDQRWNHLYEISLPWRY